MVALAAAILGACSQASPGDQADQVSDADVAARFADIPQQGNVLGSPDAPVTLVDLSDLRCSHCRDFEEISLPVIVDRYVRAGKVRVVFENYPILGPGSVEAARLAAAAGIQGREFQLVDAFFHRPPGPVTEEAMRRVASQVPGLDVDQAMSQLDSPDVDAALAEARSLGRKFSINGTPSFLLGKTGGELHVVTSARATRPETLTDPIDALLNDG